jgi:hypothetical protein
VAHACNPSYSGGSWFEDRLGKQFMTPYLEQSHHKNELVEWLKVQALSSNTSIAKRKKKKEKESLKLFAQAGLKPPSS